jgi:methylmalonyl-CoA mutase
VEECCGLSAAPAFVSAETAWRMMARRDAPTDILRTTIAAFAAALGGADAITVLPFTVAIGLPEASARRIARNIQLMLLEETQLARVADPAAGSGNIEDLTDQLCFAAWRLFQEIEAVGGAAGALERGLIADRVTAVRAARFAALAQGLEAMTGVSTFAELNVASPLPSRQAEEEKFAPLASIRLAEPFEKLRDASDRYLAATGARPKVFLAALGAAVDYAARVAFAKNFFAVGGIEAVVGESLDPAVLANAFQASGALLACLCASHRIYASQAAAATQALNAAGARHIYLVGRPQNQDAAVSVAGVESFIYEHCDALATLHGAYDILGIAIG